MVGTANRPRVDGHLVWCRTRSVLSNLHRPSGTVLFLADTCLRLSLLQSTISASIRSTWSLCAENCKVPSTQCLSAQDRVSHCLTVSLRSLRVSLHSSLVSGHSPTRFSFLRPDSWTPSEHTPESLATIHAFRRHQARGRRLGLYTRSCNDAEPRSLPQTIRIQRFQIRGSEAC